MGPGSYHPLLEGAEQFRSDNPLETERSDKAGQSRYSSGLREDTIRTAKIPERTVSACRHGMDHEAFREAFMPYIMGRAAISVNKGPSSLLVQMWNSAPLVRSGSHHGDEGCGKALLAPGSKVKVVWDLIMVINVVMAGCIVPYDVALRVEIDTYIGRRCFHIATTILFTLDIVMSLCTITYVKNFQGIVEVTDHRSIAYIYLRSWLLTDLISAFPFWFLPPAGQLVQASVRALRVHRVLVGSNSLRRDLLSHPAIPSWCRAFAREVSLTAFFTHIFACAWASCARLQTGRTWLDKVAESKSFDVEQLDPWDIYTWSFYFAATLTTTVGLGDVTPQTTLELQITCMAIIVGSIIWAHVLSTLFAVLSQVDRHREEFELMMDELRSMMHEHALPAPLLFDVQQFFCECEIAWKSQHRKHLLERMSPMLQRRVSLALCIHWVWKVGYIRDMLRQQIPGTTAFVAQVSGCLEMKLFTPGEEFEAMALYIIQRGVVACGHRVLSVGDVCGEDLLVVNPNNRIPHRPVALSLSAVQTLSVEDLSAILRQFPVQRRFIRSYSLWIAMRHGLARELRKQAGMRSKHGLKSSITLDHITPAGVSMETPPKILKPTHRSVNLQDVMNALALLTDRVQSLETSCARALSAVGPGTLHEEPGEHPPSAKPE